jgi:hypothetical protein
MDTTHIAARQFARVRRAFQQLTSPARAADQQLLELRLWRVQQARLCRQSLAVAYVRAAYAPRRGR